MEELFGILEEVRPDVDFRTIKALVTNKYIDSFDIVTIISYIEDAYSIEVPVDSMIPENFESAEAMMHLIQKLKGASI